MTDLEKAALASLPLPKETVWKFYQGSYPGTIMECVRVLCVSHERLRAELAGATILLEECDYGRKRSKPEAANELITPP